ncbi:MAG TPA: molybdate ABC transporter substrate-binding protein, partial [Thermoanaerobaculia bacterium]|nr:molybdate ABC transporter substrate-binding protein [Thermoanaerobaculia bacterium]
MRRGIRAAVLTAGAVAAGLTGCAAPAADADETLTVFAAASLQAPFTALAEEFEATHPGTTVTLSFAGSSELGAQIGQGAPADVFASADTKNMAKLADAGLVEGSPRD